MSSPSKGFTVLLVSVGAIGLGCDRYGVSVLAIQRHVGVALLLSFPLFGMRCDAHLEDLF